MKRRFVGMFIVLCLLGAKAAFAQVIVTYGQTRTVTTQEYATNTNYWEVQSGGTVVVNNGGSLTIGNGTQGGYINVQSGGTIMIAGGGILTAGSDAYSGNLNVQPGGKIVVYGSRSLYGRLLVKNGALNLANGTTSTHGIVQVNTLGKLEIANATLAAAGQVNIGEYDTILVSNGGEMILDGNTVGIGSININGGGIKLTGTSSAIGTLTVKNGNVNLANGTSAKHARIDVLDYGKISMSGATVSTTNEINIGSYDTVAVKNTGEIIIDGSSSCYNRIDIDGGGLVLRGTSSAEAKVTMNTWYSQININANGVLKLDEYGAAYYYAGGKITVNQNMGIWCNGGKISSQYLSTSDLYSVVSTPITGIGTLNNIALMTTQDFVLPGSFNYGSACELTLAGNCLFTFTYTTPTNTRKMDISGRLVFASGSTTELGAYLEDINLIAPYGGMYVNGGATINRIPRINAEYGTAIESYNAGNGNSVWKFDRLGKLNSGGRINLISATLQPFEQNLWDGVKISGPEINEFHYCTIKGIRAASGDSTAGMVFMSTATNSSNIVEQCTFDNQNYSSSRLVDGIRCLGVGTGTGQYPRASLYGNTLIYWKNGIFTQLSSITVSCNTSAYNEVGGYFQKHFQGAVVYNHFNTNNYSGVMVDSVCGAAWIIMRNNDIVNNNATQIHVCNYGQLGGYYGTEGNNIVASLTNPNSQLLTLSNYGYAEMYYSWWGANPPDGTKMNNYSFPSVNYSVPNSGPSDGSGLYWMAYWKSTNVLTGCMMKEGSEENETPTAHDVNIKIGNYPNPFNPATIIEYVLPAEMNVTLSVYSIEGKHVADLDNGVKSVGVHNVQFDARDLPSGEYIYRLNTPFGLQQGKMMLMK